MALVKFTSALNRFFPNLTDMEVEGSSIQSVMEEINSRIPGISDYILEENGSLRKHVNIFIHNDLIKDRLNLSDKVGEHDEILIYQALSGG